MRKSLRKLKEIEDAEEILAEKKPRKRRIKEREPNVFGGVLVIVTLVVVFCVIWFISQSNPSAAGLHTVKEAEEYTKIQEEKKKAAQNVKAELAKTAEDVQENINNVSVVDAAMESMEKVSHDIDAAQKLPAKSAEAAKNLKIGDAISFLVGSASRFGKIYTDVTAIRDSALQQIEKL